MSNSFPFPNENMARQYAAWFGIDAHHVFQPYVKDTSREMRHFAGRLDTLWTYIAETLVLNERWSIGFGVNIFNPESRTAKNDDVIAARAVWLSADHDRTVDETLQPTFRVQTSPGHWQYFWVIQGEWNTDIRMDEGKQGRLDFDQVQATIAHVYKGEAKAISQKLRMPGTLNYNHGAPWLVTYERLSGRTYTKDQLLKQFPPLPEPERAAVDLSDVELDVAWVEDRLAEIDPDIKHDDWVAVLIALKSLGEGGYHIARHWSSQGKKFEVQQPFDVDWKACKTGEMSELENIARKYRKPVVPTKHDQEITQIELPRKPDDLTSRAMAGTKEFLEAKNNRPSGEMYRGLEQIVLGIQAMADGADIGRDFYLSSMPAGAGKTTAVINTVGNLVRMPEYQDVGVLVLLGRIEEMQRVSEALDLDVNRYAIIANWEAPIKNAGNPDKTAAQVLFITQQRLDRLCKEHETFAEISSLYFNGKPRQVRIWDEALTPFEAVTCGTDTTAALTAKAKDENQRKLVRMVYDFETELRNAKDQDTLTVPVFSESGVSLETIKTWAKDEEEKADFENLYRFEGLTCRVRNDQFGNRVLNYVDTFPADLGPMVVMDASGPHRGVYSLWADSQNRKQKLKFLFSPQKRYDPVTVYHWDRGAGVNQYLRGGAWRELASETAKAIRAIPSDEPVLVVTRKQKKRMVDMAKAIEAELRNRGNVHFVTWGMHKATNKYVECKHVFLVGLLQYGAATDEAYGRGAKLIEASEDLPIEDHEATRLGEIKDNALQAVNRTCIRRTIGDTSPEGTVWMIFSSHSSSGIPDTIISEILPGATVREWAPVKRAEPANKRTAEIVEAWATLGVGTFRKSTLKRVAKIDNNLVYYLKSKDVIEGLKDRGLEIDSPSGRHVIIKDLHERGDEKGMDTGQLELPV